MSLLNDALRNAEQRQKGSGPSAPGVYTGGVVPSGRHPRWPLLSGLFVLLIVLLGVGVWYWQGRADPVPLTTAKESESDEAAGQVQRDPAEPEPETVPPPENEPETEPVRNSQTMVQAQELGIESAVAEPVSESQPSVPQPEPTEPSEASAVSENGADTRQHPAPMSPRDTVKQTGRSPEARDREASRQIRDWLADGRTTRAMDRLKQITAEQQAPQSRRAVARHLLAHNRPAAALEWLPASVVGEDSHLRLLRARALLSVGDPEEALGTLEMRVPPIEEHAAYRVTLATLLQRQQRFSEAANHWGALIAWDDSHAPWWAGLAMTLEAQGNTVSAVRAYRQAASLPGLSAELADYVRQRLQALQAG